MSANAQAPPQLSGILVVDKPAGWTSHDVVARVRRLLGQRKVGHAGTLDPAATGVLPLAVGSATKVLEHLTEATKTYLAEMTFGVETDSFDTDGRVSRVTATDALSESALQSALGRFRGPIEQLPPMHSAIKVNGRRLYELARAGLQIERSPRQITIFRLDLLEWHLPVATVLVDCSKGTYIRSLASDLGAALGSGAYLSNLVRLRTGPFHLCQAWTLKELETAAIAECWPEIALHPDEVLLHDPALLLDGPMTERWRSGTPLPARGVRPGPIRAYGPAGEWLGVGRFDPNGGLWRPVKVVGNAA